MQTQQPEVSRIFARYEDGGFPVVLKDTEFELLRPEGTKIFQTKRQLLVDITQHPTGRNWTFDRYFRLGKYQTLGARLEALATGNIFDICTIPVHLPSNLLLRQPKVLGIDLAKRGHEVRKLLFKGFGGKIRSAGYDAEDVLQEVYKGILVRNNGKCPFDPAKASFGHYVHMVCDCIVSNFHRKMSRQRKVEPIADENDELSMENAVGGSSAESEAMVTSDLIDSLMEDTPWGDMGQGLVTRIIPYVQAGFGRTEIADQLGMPKAAVSKALSDLRMGARQWAR